MGWLRDFFEKEKISLDRIGEARYYKHINSNYYCY